MKPALDIKLHAYASKIKDMSIFQDSMIWQALPHAYAIFVYSDRHYYRPKPFFPRTNNIAGP
jgi:hypothetical protein